MPSQKTRSPKRWPRRNPAGSATHEEEIHTLLSLAALTGYGLLGVVVPKAEDVALLHALARSLPNELAFVPLIESALGVLHALEIASIDAVTRLAFGAIDFALDIDAADGDRFLDHARAQLVLVSRAAGIAASMDSPSVEIKDAAMIAESARTARNFGFGGKLYIHPVQWAPLAGAFTPTEAEIRWAESVVGAEGAAAQIARTNGRQARHRTSEENSCTSRSGAVMGRLPLAGITVVSLEQDVAAPFATRQLADLGTRVIKIERDTGDFARGYDTKVHGTAAILSGLTVARKASSWI
jgi:citrate lyase beta subunit